MSRSLRLRRAAALIRSVVDSLNTTGETCKHCNALRRDNWLEYRAYDSLHRVPSKIEGLADDLELADAITEIHNS
jgi:hypothetical protein